LLIYSSGTTGLQKGIAHTHRTVLDSLARLRDGYLLDRASVIVGWLPLFHDMGLNTGLLLPAFTGARVVLMSPFSWVRSPKTLFTAIDRHRGTHCWMPNFAFNHSVRSVRDRDLEGIDLSSWRVLCNASEPVRLESLERFAARFASRGFARTALASAYGMTEVSGAVTLSRLGEFPPVDWSDRSALQLEGQAVARTPDAQEAIALVSSGAAIEGIEYAILDRDGAKLGDRRVGEIAVRSDFCRHGYHQRPDLNAISIRDGWFLTGDLGYTAGGELFVCGRKKDLILTGGKNVYPEDLEEIANQVPGISPGRAVAFGLDDPGLGTESAAMVCELREPLDEERRFEVERELRRRVVGAMGITLGKVSLVEDSGWVVKTSNGKIARAANRQKYLEREASLAIDR
ncbi:MAG: AMP-binding protein, partial [Candidatus Binatia bacterium]